MLKKSQHSHWQFYSISTLHSKPIILRDPFQIKNEQAFRSCRPCCKTKLFGRFVIRPIYCFNQSERLPYVYSIWNGIIYRWCAITLTSFPSFFPTQKLQKERTSDSIYNNHQIPQYRVRKKNRTINVSRPAYFCNGFTLSAPSLKFSTMVPWSPRAISLLIFSGKGSRPVNPPSSLITETASIQ